MSQHPKIVLVGVFLASVLFQWPFFDVWLSFMDEGHMLQFADMARGGGEFYRDATFYPLPGAFCFLAIVFKFFGASILVSRWVVMLEFAVFVSLIFVLLRLASSTAWGLLGVFCLWLYRIWCFPHWQIYSYSTTGLLVLLLSAAALLLYFKREERRILALSGLLFGLGVLCKQDYGAAALLALTSCLLVFVCSRPGAERPALLPLLASFFLPAASVGVLTGLYYWQAGILEDLLRFTVFNHLVGMGSYEYSEFPSLWPILGRDVAMRTELAIVEFLPGIIFTTDWPAVRGHPLFTDTPLYDGLIKLFIFGPQLLLAVAGIRLWLSRSALVASESARLAFLCEFLIFALGCGLISLVWFNRPQDYVHLAVLYWPLICLAILQVRGLLAGRRRRQWLTALLLAGPILLLVAYSGRLLWKLDASHDTRLSGPRAGIYVKPDEARMLDDVVEYIRANSGAEDRVAALPYFPLLNFLAERRAPHRSAYIVWPFPEIPDRDEEIAAAMEASRTDVVMYNFTQFYSFDPFWEHAPLLFAYLVEHFEIDRVFSYNTWGYKPAALRRRDPDAQRPGRAVLPPKLEGLVIRIEDEDGPSRALPPASRAGYAQEMLWPFRPVLALRPSSGGRRTVLELELRVPPAGGRLISAIAVHPQHWFKLPSSWANFRLVLRHGDEVEVLYERRLDPARRLEDRAWMEIDVSLDRWSDRKVSLEFENWAETPRGESLWLGGWAQPRLVASDHIPADVVESAARDADSS